MKPFVAAVILCPWLVLSAWSQPTTLPPQQALPQLRQFLGLTDSQVTAILQNNNDYNTFSLHIFLTATTANSERSIPDRRRDRKGLARSNADWYLICRNPNPFPGPPF